MNKLYFYIFRGNSFNILECADKGDKYILSNGKTRTKNDKQALDTVYGKACEVIMYSTSNDNLKVFFKDAATFINKQLSKLKRTYDNYLMKDEDEKVEKLSKKIKKYHDLLKDIFDYEEKNNIN